MKAYWFSRDDNKLRYDDNREAAVGVTHTVENPERIAMCTYGLHASVNPLDALRYAPGEVLWEVELGGTIREGADKVVASSRTYLRRLDATAVLREFARRCALDVLRLWEPPEVVQEYLVTGEEHLRDAAYAAAYAAAYDAAAANAAAAAANVVSAAQPPAARPAAYAAVYAAAANAYAYAYAAYDAAAYAAAAANAAAREDAREDAREASAAQGEMLESLIAAAFTQQEQE